MTTAFDFSARTLDGRAPVRWPTLLDTATMAATLNVSMAVTRGRMPYYVYLRECCSYSYYDGRRYCDGDIDTGGATRNSSSAV